VTKAAVVVAHNEPIEIREVELAGPKAGEVRIAVRASGVCHSDLSVQNGTVPFPAPPLVPGHECAGEVIEVGDDVSRFKVGDHVVTQFNPQCGRCYFCARGQGYLCELGATIAVLGCCGVGLNVIQGARIAGAETIIAIDRFDSKLELATSFGATQTVNAAETDPATAVRDLTEGRGADVTCEVIGLEPTIMQALDMTRRGGETILIGVPPLDATLSIPAALTFLYTNKTLRGCWNGSSNVDREVPKLLDLYQRGELKLDELISREIKLEDVNEAFAAMEAGEVARSVVVL
jgi:Zn-dependent alcohol dehydrogenase